LKKRSLANVPYIPILNLRPAEMQALEELPENDKNLMLPFIHLGPWTTAHHLASSLDRVELAYDDKPIYITLYEPESGEGDRPVHHQLANLRNPENGYKAWCQFVESKDNFIPAIQLKVLSEIKQQVEFLYSLGRGIMVSIEKPRFPGIEAIARIIADGTDGGNDVCFLLDFGKINDAILLEDQAGVYATNILTAAPNCHVAISASSFPSSFGSMSEQEIFERIGFNNLRKKPFGSRLIYSDRGSARAERQNGGGVPLPRIDYPIKSQWEFFRSDGTLEKSTAYFEQAKRAMTSTNWDSKLRVWGTQMIERTALGDQSAIVSPARSTAARINIHLHRQLFYDDPDALYDTDDTWSDL
jgi:hypothetical protein